MKKTAGVLLHVRRAAISLVWIVVLASVWGQSADEVAKAFVANRRAISTLLGYDPTKEVSVFRSVDAEGWMTIYKAPLETMKNCPPWDAHQPIPLCIDKAITLARKEARQTCEDFDKEFELIAVSLRQIDHDPLEHFELPPWFYMINFQGRVTRPVTQWPRRFTVCVLLDGTIVQPEKKKRDVPAFGDVVTEPTITIERVVTEPPDAQSDAAK